MSTPHDEAWDKFMEYIADARRRCGDTFIPVALICLQGKPRSDGAMDVYFDKDPAIIWPADVPIKGRGPLLERLAKPYRDGTVLRS
jgi:hypothetical protein